jgi:ACS family hexuronate transporter-like MFS transporter
MGFAEGSANPAGMMLAGPLVALSVYYLNWQSAFVISSGLGLVWVCLWLLLFDLPSRHRWLSEGERHYIAEGQEKSLGYSGKPSVRQIIRQRNFWGIAIPRFLADPAWGTLSFWLPLYLAKERHWDLRTIAGFSWLPFLAADFGCLFGGLLAATLQKYAGTTLINARRWAFTAGAGLMVSAAFAGRVDDPYLAILLFSLAGFAHQTLSVTVITMASDLFPRSEVATVAGLAGTCGNAGVLLFTLMVGALVTRIGYSPFFACLSILDILGAIVLWALVRERRAA